MHMTFYHLTSMLNLIIVGVQTKLVATVVLNRVFGGRVAYWVYSGFTDKILRKI